jgi:hypothetical protein
MMLRKEINVYVPSSFLCSAAMMMCVERTATQLSLIVNVARRRVAINFSPAARLFTLASSHRCTFGLAP